MLKQEKGITLIALIITIIVLLILSLVTIQSLGGSDSAPEKASQASAQENVADIKDAITTESSAALTDWYAVKYAGATSPTISAADVQVYSRTRIVDVVSPLLKDGEVITNGKTKTGVTVKISADKETTGTHKDQYKIELSNDKASATGYITTSGGVTWE